MAITKFSNTIAKDSLAIVGVLAISACLGIAMNFIRKDSIPWNYQTVKDRLAADVAATKDKLDFANSITSKGQGVRDIQQDEFVKLVESKKVVILDARPEVFHRLGHISGAISFPRGEFAKVAEQHSEILKNAANDDIPITIYCANLSCKDAELVSQGLKNVGIPDHWIFRPGWAGWKSENLPMENNL